MAMSGLHPAFIEKFMLMAMSNLMRKKEAEAIAKIEANAVENSIPPEVGGVESNTASVLYNQEPATNSTITDLGANFTEALSMADLTTVAKMTTGLDWKGLTKCRKQNEWDLPQSTDFYRPRYAAKPAFQDVPTSFATLSNMEHDSTGVDNEVRL
ncbi:Oidioi.mRNA.OKI2018_I69.XSR.g16664.t1.cds [Oikopleura dioica]|uniref:Oidioi.mRNA.OKI2018_I69.XSR.g16664.t1.cds n=1 Tax=Oikopleura dioica TaxID=34765 RepID=A0ABN7SP61_OIKDI|nr:Oidioi.mRNA.OKI2018_I69.XSR.g16664.t1.cds [Oikopleura dioica]